MALRRACVVLDLDETVLYRTRGFMDTLMLYAPSFMKVQVGMPCPQVASALDCISANFDLVAVTARWERSEARTMDWIKQYGLPIPSVLFSPRPHPTDGTRNAFKRAAIAGWLAKHQYDTVLGIGDRPSDLQAYLAAGCQCVMVTHMCAEAGREITPHVSDFDATAHTKCTDRISKLRAAEAALQGKYSIHKKVLPNMPDVIYLTDSEVAYKTHLDVTSAGYSATKSDARTGLLPPVWEQVKTLLCEPQT